MRTLFTAVLFLLASAVSAETILTSGIRTSASGMIFDKETGQTVPYANVVFVGSDIGTMSDENGCFSISNDQGFSTLAVTMLSYKTVFVNILPGKNNDDLKIILENDAFRINDIVVKPSRKKSKYKRKGNPALELARKVIGNKDGNNLSNKDFYKATCYEKLVMSLDRFDVDFDSSRLWSNFAFLKDYLDTSTFNSSPVLSVSLRESIYDDYHQLRPHEEKRIVRMKNMQGVDKLLEREGLGSNLDAMLQSVDIFSDNIEILLNSFVSPLSSSLATNYYKYYIMDTTDVAGVRCTDLAFVPVNSESYGFTGHLYVTTDGTYSLKKYVLNVPAKINLNFVSNLSVSQEFDRLEDGTLAPVRYDTYVNFSLFKNMRQIYAHQRKIVTGYQFEIPEDEMSRALSIKGDSETLPGATAVPKSRWPSYRPQPLSKSESFIDSLVIELEQVPKFRRTVKAAEIIVSGYVPTSRNRLKSKFDFGPIYNTVSWNRTEGVRVRLGGMTTANINPNWFANGYIAFGCKDRRVKYNLTGIYSFVPKEYHAYESFRNTIYLSSTYDIETPGQMYSVFDRDNIFMSLNFNKGDNYLQYVMTNRILYEREWPSRIGIQAWAQHRNVEAAGDLRFEHYCSDGAPLNIGGYNEVSTGVKFRYAPGERIFNNRMGRSSLFNLSNEAPVIWISHEIGWMEGNHWFNRTEFSAQKRFWMSVFGHIDATLGAGIEWNKVPFTKLFIPMTNQSLFLQPGAFNMMLPMEFLYDKYAMLHATWYMKGLILNRLPLIQKLRFREVLSFSALYGSLSSVNNPMISPDGLYAFPAGASKPGRYPYMEFTAGIENILKVLRIDYVRRLNYLENERAAKNGVRLSFRFTF